MSNFRIETTKEVITSNTGIVLVGQILNSAKFRNCVLRVVGHQTKYSSSHFTDLEIVRCYVALLCVGKPRPESIDIFKDDEAFKAALELKKLPSKETLRQRLDVLPDGLNEALRDFTAEFIRKHSELPVITGTDYIPVDFDVTPFDNSNSQKEGVSFTYKNFMGFAPMITYIGATGYMLNNEFREGKEHSNCPGTSDYIKRTLELARMVTNKKLLARFDSGNDSIENVLVIDKFENAYYLIKRNLRKESPDKYIELAKNESAIREHVRDGKIVYYSENKVTLKSKPKDELKSVEVRQVVRLTERTVDKDKQPLLFPLHEIDVWYTNVEEKHNCKKIVDLYKDHGTCEQFHSELKTDLDIERMPSGKFETNRLILTMAMVAFNILRLIGQETIKSGHANRKKEVGRLRIRKVLQDIMYMAGKFLFKRKLPTIKIPEINKFKEAFCFIFGKLQLE
jgi:hypothetical protein